MENPKFVIAINREFGSGGKEIAYKLGELLGINVYDKAILDTLTSKFNLTIEEMQHQDQLVERFLQVLPTIWCGWSGGIHRSRR